MYDNYKYGYNTEWEFATYFIFCPLSTLNTKNFCNFVTVSVTKSDRI